MKAMLSGPMTGYPDYNYSAFNRAALELRRMAFEVLNPAEFFKSKRLRQGYYMGFCVFTLIEKKPDVLVLLPDWEQSEGARIEVAVARELGIRVVPLEQILIR